MYLIVRSNRIELEHTRDFTRFELAAALDHRTLSTILRGAGAGYAEPAHAYVNVLWLRRQRRGIEWHRKLDDLVSFAGSCGWFDGLYLRVPYRPRTSPVRTDLVDTAPRSRVSSGPSA